MNKIGTIKAKIGAYMVVPRQILFGNHFLKGALGFSLIGFSCQFGRIRETSHTPELISGVLNDARFYPLTAFGAVMSSALLALPLAGIAHTRTTLRSLWNYSTQAFA